MLSLLHMHVDTYAHKCREGAAGWKADNWQRHAWKGQWSLHHQNTYSENAFLCHLM